MRVASWHLLAVVCFGWLAAPALAEVRAHRLFTDHAVLQQGIEAPVWGFADGAEQVTVKFQGQEVVTTAADGKWMVRLAPLEAGGPFDLVIAGPDNTVTVQDVLVGEVWVASGQSNMWWPVSHSANPDETAAAAGNEKLRLFSVPLHPAAEPEADVESQWNICAPETVRDFSAVAYAFGLHLQEKLGVPVGMINTSYGGTVAEAWTSRQSLEANEEYKAAFLAAPVDGANPNSPTALFNAMIHPLIPYAIKGAIWYQGESNAGRAKQYRQLFPTMIADWRQAWGQGDFPFLFVQLAPFMKIETEPMDSAWAELREAQFLTSLHCPNTAQAVITDLGDEADIHPKQKQPVGDRLALAARALAYGQDVHHTGPVYDSLTISGERAIVQFRNVGDGLLAKEGELTGFTLCGEDGKFHNATAVIEGESVLVTCPEVPNPVAVRFGWANFPVVNLYSQQGLPASPFRTDEFPGVTQ